MHGESGVEQAESRIVSPSSSTNEVSPRIRRNSTNLGVPFLEQFNPESSQDSHVAARELFKLLISPVDIDQFYA